MASQTVVSGYIQSVNKHNIFNESYIRSLDISSLRGIEVLPKHIQGFGASLFMLGGIVKLKYAEWSDFVKCIESILLEVKAFSIKLNLENSDEGLIHSYEYVNISITEEDVGKDWKKYLVKYDGDTAKEISF